ncbi:hypothetical protein A1R12_05895 [Bacillus amyloliquefaciens]|nr:hypothetical protein A1R12_05895 [Bacillus amyloliquefaciens]
MANTAALRKSFTIQEMTHAAANEISYMSGNSESTSYHFAVDDKEVIQGALHLRQESILPLVFRFFKVENPLKSEGRA